MRDRDTLERYVQEAIHEPEVITQCRKIALELDAEPIDAATGAQCAALVAASKAQSVVEIGTGAGISALWLLHGCPQAVLTTIDQSADRIEAARKNFARAEIPATRTRLITDEASDVLPRMNEGSYDVVLVDANPDGVIDYLEHSLRLVRPGGSVLIPRVFSGGSVADPTKRDDTTTNYRALIQETQNSPSVIGALSIGGVGLLQVTTRTVADQ